MQNLAPRKHGKLLKNGDLGTGLAGSGGFEEALKIGGRVDFRGFFGSMESAPC